MANAKTITKTFENIFISDDPLRKRVDYRDTFCISIDNKNTRAVDDVLSIKRLDN